MAVTLVITRPSTQWHDSWDDHRRCTNPQLVHRWMNSAGFYADSNYVRKRRCKPTKITKPTCCFLFPACQVRVVRFYQSCSLPPRLALLFLFSTASSSASSPSSFTSTSTVALPTLRQALRQRPSSVCTAGPQPGTFPAQCAPLDLNLGAAQLRVDRWTSTWDLPSSVCTAGPQPGTFPAQCAPLDLNLGPSQLSVHRWASTAR